MPAEAKPEARPTDDESAHDALDHDHDHGDCDHDHHHHEPYRREAPKVGRNDPCPCGSGRKYKVCHGAS